METSVIHQDYRGKMDQETSPEIQELRQLIQEVNGKGDQQTASKIEELLIKWLQKNWNIAFCGHFSAGKSTMINQLLEKSILPSSPIPTSANVVTICYGEPKAIIELKDQQKIEVPLANIDQWKAYCKDGEEVERVTIYDQNEKLKNGIQLLDTPGIDSTDEGHQQATSAALHLADLIFFVTDYNHVQSEENFQFIKTLKEQGKPLILIINQIDKHQGGETSIHDYIAKVKGSLADWGIAVDGMICTSMLNQDHPLNQFTKLDQAVTEMKELKDHWLNQQLVRSIQQTESAPGVSIS